MSKLRHMHQDVSLIILFVTKSKSQFPDFGVMGTMVGPLPILATKGLSATATELRARLILEPARRARRRQGRSALCAKAPRRRVFVYVPGRGIGLGVDYYIERIGGEDGFRAPMTSAIGSYFGRNGPDADPGPIKARLREAILAAPPGHRTEATIKEYASDKHLDSIIGWVKGQERAKRAANGNAAACGNGLDREALARRKIAEIRRQAQRAWEEL